MFSSLDLFIYFLSRVGSRENKTGTAVEFLWNRSFAWSKYWRNLKGNRKNYLYPRPPPKPLVEFVRRCMPLSFQHLLQSSVYSEIGYFQTSAWKKHVRRFDHPFKNIIALLVTWPPIGCIGKGWGRAVKCKCTSGANFFFHTNLTITFPLVLCLLAH